MRMITGNEFNYGSYGIHQSAINTSQANSGSLVVNNQFNNQRSYGAYFLYDKNLKLRNNSVGDSPTYGFYLQSCDDELEISGNKVNANTYAVYLYSCTGGSGLDKERGLVANNFIYTGSSGVYSLYSYSNTDIDFYHNSVNCLSNNASSSSFYIYAGSDMNIVNNIFLHKGSGYAYYVYTPGAVNTSNYNDLYAYGANLGYWNGNTADLAAFRLASSKEANAVSTNPGFLSNTDMHAVSALLDSAGTPLSRVMVDIDGEMRHALFPDIGADEFDSTAVVGIEDEHLVQNAIPDEFHLYNNYPNPFNPVTYIKYDLPAAVHVKLEVYNTLGQLVTVLVDARQNAGIHILPFNAVNLATGTYFYRIQTETDIEVRKMILNK
jgi:hypothetical protein